MIYTHGSKLILQTFASSSSRPGVMGIWCCHRKRHFYVQSANSTRDQIWLCPGDYQKCMIFDPYEWVTVCHQNIVEPLKTIINYS